MISLPTSIYQSLPNHSNRQVSASLVFGADFYQTPSCFVERNMQGRGKDPRSLFLLKEALLNEPNVLSSPS